ncbi:MAG: hypothetical protein K8T25_20850 [Planctomycetia bacterium]|nr:hypothetical protein [Planctomycetia bacterium]
MAFAILLAMCGAMASTAAAAEPLLNPAAGEPASPIPKPAAAEERFLFLTNGQVMRGRIALDGDRYVVTSERAEIRIAARDVEYVCRTINEGYLLKRAGVNQTNARDHLRLAQWCLTQGLLDEADEERRRAAEIEPGHPRLTLLERQLKLAREPVAPQPAPPKLAQPQREPKLDAAIRGLPGPAVEAFSQTVQPLLLNNCATAGCHGPATKSEFQLVRLARGQTPIRRVTQRNLAAVLTYLDMEEPDQSRILTAARQAHGGASAATFPRSDQAAYRRLAQWVRQVSAPAPNAPPETVNAPTTTLSQSISPSGSTTAAPAAANPIAASPSPASKALRNLPNRPASHQPVSHQIEDKPRNSRLIVDEGSATARDPFDPELFNRRYHVAKPVPASDGGIAKPPQPDEAP